MNKFHYFKSPTEQNALFKLPVSSLKISESAEIQFDNLCHMPAKWSFDISSAKKRRNLPCSSCNYLLYDNRKNILIYGSGNQNSFVIAHVFHYLFFTTWRLKLLFHILKFSFLDHEIYCGTVDSLIIQTSQE